MLLEEKLNFQNYLYDMIDLSAMRQILYKSRHKLLIPIVVLELNKSKQHQTRHGYKTSFLRNIHERTDKPIFSLDEAISDIKNPGQNRHFLERELDEFFLTTLPDNVLKLGKDKFEDADCIEAKIQNKYNKKRGSQARSNINLKIKESKKNNDNILGNIRSNDDERRNTNIVPQKNDKAKNHYKTYNEFISNEKMCIDNVDSPKRDLDDERIKQMRVMKETLKRGSLDG